MEMEKIKDSLETECHELLFNVRRSVRYHNRRRTFFERFHLLTNTIAVIFGSATILTVLSDVSPYYPVAAGATVSFAAALDLVWGFSRMACLHADLARRFIALEREMVLARHYTEEDLDKFTAKRLDIEADEPPVMRVLDSLCYNELTRAMGYSKEHFVRVRWYQRLLAQFVDVREHRVGHA